jgi:hypothetical protein
VRGDVRGRRSPPSRGRVSFGGETPRTRTAATYDGGGQEGCPGDRRREVVHLVFLRARDAMTSAAKSPMRCGNAARHASRTGLPVTNPRNGSGPRGREAMRGENRRGGEKPRGRNEPGDLSPGDADPHAHVVEGAKKPQEGNLGRKAGVGNAASALRGAQACGSRLCDPGPQGSGGVRRKARDERSRDRVEHGQTGWRNTSRSSRRRGGSGEGIRRYARQDASRGRANPARVSGMSATASRSAAGSQTPGGALAACPY